MKATAAMKAAMKAMKAKKVSVIARGICQGCCLQGQEGEDRGWPHEGYLDQEQVWQDSEQGCICTRQEGVCNERIEEVGCRHSASSQGARHHGLLSCGWQDGAGESAVCQDQGNPWLVRQFPFF